MARRIREKLKVIREKLKSTKLQKHILEIDPKSMETKLEGENDNDMRKMSKEIIEHAPGAASENDNLKTKLEGENDNEMRTMSKEIIEHIVSENDDLDSRLEVVNDTEMRTMPKKVTEHSASDNNDEHNTSPEKEEHRKNSEPIFEQNAPKRASYLDRDLPSLPSSMSDKASVHEYVSETEKRAMFEKEEPTLIDTTINDVDIVAESRTFTGLSTPLKAKVKRIKSTSPLITYRSSRLRSVSCSQPKCEKGGNDDSAIHQSFSDDDSALDGHVSVLDSVDIDEFSRQLKRASININSGKRGANGMSVKSIGNKNKYKVQKFSLMLAGIKRENDNAEEFGKIMKNLAPRAKKRSLFCCFSSENVNKTKETKITTLTDLATSPNDNTRSTIVSQTQERETDSNGALVGDVSLFSLYSSPSYNETISLRNIDDIRKSSTCASTPPRSSASNFKEPIATPMPRNFVNPLKSATLHTTPNKGSVANPQSPSTSNPIHIQGMNA